MKTTLAMFGAFTALNTLWAVIFILRGFDKSWVLDLYLDFHLGTYIFLALSLLCDLGVWGYYKWKYGV